VKEKAKNIYPIAVHLEAFAYKGMRQKKMENEKKNCN